MTIPIYSPSLQVNVLLTQTVPFIVQSFRDRIASDCAVPFLSRVVQPGTYPDELASSFLLSQPILVPCPSCPYPVLALDLSLTLTLPVLPLSFLVCPALDLPCPSCPCPHLSLPVTFWSGIRVSLPGHPLAVWACPQSLNLNCYPLANLPSSLPTFPQAEAET